MKLNRVLTLLAMVSILSSCKTKQAESDTPIIGTWELVSATTTEKDSTFSTFDPTHKMIKIINPTHFAFLNHKVNTPKDSSNAFTAGGGTYTLADSTYTEHLDYFSDKNWEGNKFKFIIKISGDTLVQKGIEKVEKLGIDHIIIETYKRVKN
ncbi:lipocalin family protein [Spirosoma validum]|uniref:Lipocalin-like domain-containing protein n=1 Tax=Spirosoma validum TaxID=2771355 RepID=A0A927B587_9BACT|nr:lipocalin family protein [Spirosoma validum]MBD2755624.1 lipocalin-like domain-containing protein [Spirosoma validum]